MPSRCECARVECWLPIPTSTDTNPSILIVQVVAFYFLKKHNIFGYNDTGKLKMPESTLKYIAENRQRDLEQSFARRH